MQASTYYMSTSSSFDSTLFTSALPVLLGRLDFPPSSYSRGPRISTSSPPSLSISALPSLPFFLACAILHPCLSSSSFVKSLVMVLLGCFFFRSMLCSYLSCFGFRGGTLGKQGANWRDESPGELLLQPASPSWVRVEALLMASLRCLGFCRAGALFVGPRLLGR